VNGHDLSLQLTDPLTVPALDEPPPETPGELTSLTAIRELHS
jgi:hypothetical protein